MNPDIQLASTLAKQAGEHLLHIRSTTPINDPKKLSRRGDLAANTFLLGQLSKLRPDDPVLSEESADDLSRLDATRVWIIDPLDGSREFSTPGRDDWAVHVALWEACQGITAAAVAQPSLDQVYASEGHSYRASRTQRKRPLILVSDSRPPRFSDVLASRLGADVMTMGSAGAKSMAVLRGEADAYIHAGGQWEWDSAAPVGVVEAAGLHASRIDGSKLTYNQSDPYLPDLLVCQPEWANSILEEIASLCPQD